MVRTEIITAYQRVFKNTYEFKYTRYQSKKQSKYYHIKQKTHAGVKKSKQSTKQRSRETE